MMDVLMLIVVEICFQICNRYSLQVPHKSDEILSGTQELE